MIEIDVPGRRINLDLTDAEIAPGWPRGAPPRRRRVVMRRCSMPMCRELAGQRVTGGGVIWREGVERWHPGQAWIWQRGGMGAFDPGIAATSLLTHLVPEPVRVTGATFETPENCATPVAARLSLPTGGGARALADGKLLSDGAALDSGDTGIYDRFAGLIAARRSDVNLSPMTLVADAFMLAGHARTDPFHDEQSP